MKGLTLGCAAVSQRGTSAMFRDRFTIARKQRGLFFFCRREKASSDAAEARESFSMFRLSAS